MEDYSPATSEGEETPLKRRRFLRGNFLDSWLDRREDEDDDPEDSADKPKKSKSERWRDKLRNIFSGLVSLEPVSKDAVAEKLPKVEYEPVSVLEQVERPAAVPETIQTTPVEDGVLTVSHDAQERNYDYDDSPEETSIHEESELEVPTELEAVEVDYIDSEQPEVIEERAAAIEREQAQAVSAILPNSESAPRNNSAVPVSEVLQRRQAERLEKKVKKLKRETKTIKREQADVRQQQQEFAKKLEERQKAQARFEKVTVPKMEKARQQLKKRLETTPEQPVPPTVEVRQEKPEVKAVISETSKQPLEIKSEYRPEVKPQVIKTEQPAKAETIAIPNLEVVPEPTIISEKLYDQRREVKDLAGYQPATSSLASSQIGRTPVPSVPPPLVGPMLPSPSPTNIDSPQKIALKDNDMYKQAAKNGSLAGIIMLILLSLILLLMRL